MKLEQNNIIYSPSDLSGHISCKHLTTLNKKVLLGQLSAPVIHKNASLEALKKLGIAFEQDYLQKLKDDGLRVFEIDYTDQDAEAMTIQAMEEGYDVIYQARLKTAKWSGWADFLLKVDKPCKKWPWSYQAWDTKLANTTKASTLLQIGLYSQRVGEIQGADPEIMGVIKPEGEEIFRYHDYAAYIRHSQKRLENFLAADADTYPEPVSFCDICQWWETCNRRRREDDHLTFVAGMGQSQITELRSQGIPNLARLAEQPNPLPFKPGRGDIQTYNRLRDQAKIQDDSRRQDGIPLHEVWPTEAGRGLFLLPEPSEHDIFLDFEGARMVQPDGLEYLIGYCYQGNYHARWASNEEEELARFEAFIDWAFNLKQQHPELHIYHYAPYEPTAFKRLMGKYARREAAVDAFLRSGTFVDLFRVLRQSVIASVERYSLKDLEPFFGYQREMDLRRVSAPKTAYELLLELRKPQEASNDDLAIIEKYNEDDCRALVRLQQWLEEIRQAEINKGTDIPRPELRQGEASENITQHQERIKPIFETLHSGVPQLPGDRSEEQQIRFILAHFLDWYRREQKALWWDYFRLRELDPDELLSERKAVGMLQFSGKSSIIKKSRVDTYTFPAQEADLKIGDQLKNQQGEGVGTLIMLDREQGILEIKKGPKVQHLDHPAAVLQLQPVPAEEKEESIIRLAAWVAENGIQSDDPQYLAARNLLLRNPPQIPPMQAGQRDIDHVLGILLNMQGGYLAIQGPPGAGKSHIGSHLILRLVQAGKKIGITALSHKVITNLLEKTQELATQQNTPLRILQKISAGENGTDRWTTEAANDAVESNFDAHDIIAGTSFLWAREAFSEKNVDYMFVDEAGQLALIDTVALAQAARNLVLLGDPNQLQQPQQGVHPDGTQASALEHILNGETVIPAAQGIFLESTWRMHPAVNRLVSELFYQSRLKTEDHLSRQQISGPLAVEAGLALLEVKHEGNSNSSPEEVSAVKKFVEALTNGNSRYTDDKGATRAIRAADIKIISPYNAQVNLLKTALPGIEIGTVDKFQGQEAPVIIYSVASSSPELAPRGMDFLYSPNRFNVAVSRAKVLFVMVSTAEIFEAECKSPKEMALANAFSRFTELAQPLPAE